MKPTINPSVYRQSDGDLGYEDTPPHPRLYPPYIPSAKRLAALDRAAKISRRWALFKQVLEVVSEVSIVALAMYVLVLL